MTTRELSLKDVDGAYHLVGEALRELVTNEYGDASVIDTEDGIALVGRDAGEVWLLTIAPAKFEVTPA